MQETTNLHLKKPEYADAADIGDLNDNMDILDAAVTGKKGVQTAVSDPSADGTAFAFIDSISQAADGVITPTKKTVPDMGGATSESAGTHGLVPAPAAGDEGKVLQGDGTWVKPNKASAADSSAKLFLIGAETQAEEQETYSQDTAYVGTDGELYSGGSKVAHDDAVVKLTGNQSVAGVKTFTNTTDSSSKTTGAVKISGGLGVAKNIYGDRVYGGAWNDYAEYREADINLPGRVLTETPGGVMELATDRLMPACRVITDTYGYCIGESEKNMVPVAVAGRVLVKPYGWPSRFSIGDAVCSGPGGTVDVMSRREIRKYPDRIIGIVSEIPKYEKWNNVNVDGRIWIYVR